MRTSRHPTLEAAVVALTILTFGACGGGGGEGGSETSGAGETAEASGDGGGGSSCVAEYADAPCGLLTADLVRAALPDAPAEIEQDSYSGASFSSCTYSWPSDRMETVTVGGRSMEYNADNSVALSWIETYEENPGDRFRRSYLPTEEELQRGREAFRERLDETAEEEGLSEDQEGIARGLAEGAMARMQFEPVDGVGDRASWSSGSLYVLDGDTKFEVTADVSAEGAEDRAAAVEIARALVAACE